MNITLTVRGALEEDAALQEIVSILYRKASETRGEIEAGRPEADDGKTNAYVPAPKPETAAVAIDEGQAEEAPAPAAPTEPERPALEFEDVRKAAASAMDRGKRAEVKEILLQHGERLADVDPAKWPEILEAIEAL